MCTQLRTLRTGSYAPAYIKYFLKFKALRKKNAGSHERGFLSGSHQGMYPRVNSFDALKQSTDSCAHRITFSSRKIIILNKLSCFQSKHTFWEVRKHLFCLKYRITILRDTSFDAFHWLLKKTIFSL